MDTLKTPLSISVSIIAIIGATTSTIKAARTIYKAPEELESLLNDLTDTELMLRDVHVFLQDDGVPLIGRTTLQERLSEAETVLLQLKAVLDDLVNPDNSTKVRRYRWLKAKQRTRKLARKLVLIHEDLPKRMDQLGKRRLELELRSLSLAQSQMNSTVSEALDPDNGTWSSITRRLQEETHTSVEELRHNTSALLARLEATMSKERASFIAPPTQSPPEYSSRQLSTSSGHCKASPPTHQSIMIQARYYTPSFCSESCHCSCHLKRNFATPSLLSAVLGQLFIGYRGIPLAAGPCDQSHCKRNSHPSISATYYFPHWWVVNRIIIFTLKHRTGNPEVALKFPRVVHPTTPVFYMAKMGNIEGLKRLFRTGEASPNDVRPWKSSYTLLQVALVNSDWSVFRFLLQAGADPEIEDYYGRTPLELTCQTMFSGTMMPHSMHEWVAEQFLPKLLDYSQFPSLHETVLGLRTSTIEQEVKKLISSSATINDLDHLGHTALAWASLRGDLTSVMQLIEHAADPNVESSQKVYALCNSLRSGAVECAMYLLEHGANPNSVDVEGHTTLHLAVANSIGQRSSIPLLDELFRLGVDLNEKDGPRGHDITPLGIAIQRNKFEATRWLLSHGADYRNPSPNYGPYLHDVAWWGNLATIKVIRKARWSGIDTHARCSEAGEEPGTAMEWLLHEDRFPPASPELIESFALLLAEIEARTCNQDFKNEVEDESVTESEDEIFQDSVDFQDNSNRKC